MQEAYAGQVIGINVRYFSRKELKIGDVISDLTNGEPARAALRVIAQVTVMMSPIKIKHGFEATLHCRAAHVPCKLRHILAKLDKRGNPVQ